MLRRRRCGLPSRPFGRFVNHDPRMREREPPSLARRLQDDRPHRIGHSLHDDRDLDPAADDVADGIVDGETVGDVSAGAVDVERDRADCCRSRARAGARCSCGRYPSRCHRSGTRRAAVRRLLCGAARGRRRRARRSDDRSVHPSTTIISFPGQSFRSRRDRARRRLRASSAQPTGRSRTRAPRMR